MKIFCTLTRRELAAFFCSFTGYVIIAAVTLLTGLSFVLLMRNLGSDPFSMPVTELFFNSFLFWVIVILATPIITMRSFALEKATGTYETLMTTPVTDLVVVAAKFTTAVIFYVVMWLPTLGSLFIVRHFTNQTGALDAGTLGGMYLGIFLSGCLFLSAGLLRVGVDPQSGRGGGDQSGGGSRSVHPGLFDAGGARRRAMADAGAFVLQFVQADG